MIRIAGTNQPGAYKHCGPGYVKLSAVESVEGDILLGRDSIIQLTDQPPASTPQISVVNARKQNKLTYEMFENEQKVRRVVRQEQAFESPHAMENFNFAQRVNDAETFKSKTDR
jgi:hypothetical protein